MRPSRVVGPSDESIILGDHRGYTAVLNFNISTCWTFTRVEPWNRTMTRKRPAVDERHARARPEPDPCETFDSHGTDRYLPRVEVPSTDF